MRWRREQETTASENLSAACFDPTVKTSRQATILWFDSSTPTRLFRPPGFAAYHVMRLALTNHQAHHSIHHAEQFAGA